jgi:hypothetical protein
MPVELIFGCREIRYFEQEQCGQLSEEFNATKNVHATNITCGAMTSIAMVSVKEAFR